MASLIATPLPALGIVRLILDWTPTYRRDAVRVYRITPDGVEAEVIGGPTYLSNGLAILYDTTAPFDVELTYRAQVVNPTIAFDEFARNASNGWGTAPLGGTYVPRIGAASDFSTTFFSGGMISSGTTGIPRLITLPVSVANVSAGVSVRVGVTPPVVGSAIFASLFLRYIDTSNFYQFALSYNTNNTVTARLMRRQTTPSVLTTIAETVIATTFSATQWFRIEAEAVGTTLRFRAWSGVRPTEWTIVATDTTHQGPGQIGFNATMNTGLTNTLPIVTYFDLFEAQEWGTFTLTSAPVTLEAGRDGWLRDPQEPARSVRMDNCASHTFECLDADRFVFFQGMGDEAYNSATGVFEVVDSPFPLTVAQTRKSVATNLRVVSTTLADIPALKELFSPGRDLLLSLPGDYGWGLDSYHTTPVTVGDVQVARLNQRDMRKPQRLWSLPIRVTDDDTTYPGGRTGSNGVPVPGATYADTTATGLTYGQLVTGGKRYIQWSEGVFV